MEFVVYRYALAGYRCRIYNQFLTGVPWIDTGNESGTSKGCLQTCPGWIQVSNLQTTHADMPWLDTGIESGIGRLQICPGWIHESYLENAKGW